MTKPIVVYLAGAVDKEPWRAKIIQDCRDLAIEFESPIDNISYSYQSLCSVHKANPSFDIADFLKVNRCDVVFAYVRDGSDSLYSGTSCEIGYAYGAGKTIILINDMPPGRACKYEFIKRKATRFYTTIEEAVDCLRSLALEMAYSPGKEDK